MNADPPIEHPPPPAEQGEAASALLPDKEKQLSADEQMAMFEEALKESDWGHQPC